MVRTEMAELGLGKIVAHTGKNGLENCDPAKLDSLENGALARGKQKTDETRKMLETESNKMPKRKWQILVANRGLWQAGKRVRSSAGRERAGWRRINRG